jgi:hypothetical protein
MPVAKKSRRGIHGVDTAHLTCADVTAGFDSIDVLDSHASNAAQTPADAISAPAQRSVNKQHANLPPEVFLARPPLSSSLQPAACTTHTPHHHHHQTFRVLHSLRHGVRFLEMKFPYFARLSAQTHPLGPSLECDGVPCEPARAWGRVQPRAKRQTKTALQSSCWKARGDRTQAALASNVRLRAGGRTPRPRSRL